MSKFSGDVASANNTDNELSVISSNYDSFLRECNAVDVAGVYAAVASACTESAELAEIISGSSFLIVNPQFHCQFEVLLRMFCVNKLPIVGAAVASWLRQ